MCSAVVSALFLKWTQPAVGFALVYIGHFAAAAVILTVGPEVPALPIAVAVAWPDLVWPALVFAGKERVKVDRDNPLQAGVEFTSYRILIR
jgi:hypothetical protein